MNPLAEKQHYLSTSLAPRGLTSKPSNRTARNSKPLEVIGTITIPLSASPARSQNLSSWQTKQQQQQKSIPTTSISPTSNLTQSHGQTGTYDPIPKVPLDGETGRAFKDIKLDTVRAKYWLGVGAQPSDPAWRLLSMVCFPIQFDTLVWMEEITDGVQRRGLKGNEG